MVLGRDPTCDIPLEDLGASRRHALIRYEEGTYFLEDLGSKNGTVVNEALVQRAALRGSDEILIGAVRAVFRRRGRSCHYECRPFRRPTSSGSDDIPPEHG